MWSSGAGIDPLHQAALTTRGLIGMNDALGSSHIEALHRETHVLVAVLRADGLHRGLHAGAKLALGGLVALGRLGVGENALLLTLDIRHVRSPFSLTVVKLIR